MNLCNDGHEEVCYEVRNCPCCDLIKDRDGWEAQAGDNADKASRLEDELGDVNDERERLKEELSNSLATIEELNSRL